MSQKVMATPAVELSKSKGNAAITISASPGVTLRCLPRRHAPTGRKIRVRIAEYLLNGQENHVAAVINIARHDRGEVKP